MTLLALLSLVVFLLGLMVWMDVYPSPDEVPGDDPGPKAGSWRIRNDEDAEL